MCLSWRHHDTCHVLNLCMVCLKIVRALKSPLKLPPDNDAFEGFGGVTKCSKTPKLEGKQA